MTENTSTPFDQVQNFAMINGVSLHYALEGDASKPTLVLINMASHNLTCWEIVLADLAKHFQILRFDLRGTGKSGWGDDEAFNFSQYADDLAGLLDHLDLGRVFVVGVAYGARTAAQFGLRHPQRLSGLGLFDVALTPPVDQTDQGALGARAIALLKESGNNVPERQKYWRFYEDRDAARKCHTAHEREPDTTALIHAIKTPTLVACGEQDMNLPAARYIAEQISDARFVPMAMTGHGSPFFRPDLFAQLICEFIPILRLAD
jgi:3-oxoadipate enol-lactonase